LSPPVRNQAAAPPQASNVAKISSNIDIQSSPPNSKPTIPIIAWRAPPPIH
jgi:hypothetical protein